MSFDKFYIVYLFFLSRKFEVNFSRPQSPEGFGKKTLFLST